MIKLYMASLKRIINKEVYPGTLNIILKQKLCLQKGLMCWGPYGFVYIYPARLNGFPVYIIRGQRRIFNYGAYYAEVIATKSLRRRLLLNNGDSVTLSVEEQYLR